LWITLNEPYVVTLCGYGFGIHAPGKKLMLDAKLMPDALSTAHHQLLGHGLANAALRSAGAREVMLSNNYSPAWPASESAADRAATSAFDVLQNRLFTDPVLLGSYPDLAAFGVGEAGLDCVADGDLATISAPIDALGVNYYSPTRLTALPDSPIPFQFTEIPGYPVTAYGWPVVPAGLRELLTTTLGERYGAALPPVYITENGCSQPDQPGPDGVVHDQGRIDYLDGHLRALHEAITAGIDVRGYFQWTLADNFEWTEGFTSGRA
jgi:beta-glucosidase